MCENERFVLMLYLLYGLYPSHVGILLWYFDIVFLKWFLYRCDVRRLLSFPIGFFIMKTMFRYRYRDEESSFGQWLKSRFGIRSVFLRRNNNCIVDTCVYRIMSSSLFNSSLFDFQSSASFCRTGWENRTIFTILCSSGNGTVFGLWRPKIWFCMATMQRM